MVDVFDKETRSKIMSRIRSKNTKPEVILRQKLWNMNLRYRIHKRDVGNADIVFKSKKVAIFVDGDFWHGYNWIENGKVPPKGFWQDKIKRNMERDKKTTMELKENGWTVLRFWEHEVLKNTDSCVEKICNSLDRANLLNIADVAQLNVRETETSASGPVWCSGPRPE